MSSKATEAMRSGLASDSARDRFWRDRARAEANSAKRACPDEWDTVAAAHLADELRAALLTAASELEVEELWKDLLIAALDEVDWLDVARDLLAED